jgi:hypothetical protein
MTLFFLIGFPFRPIQDTKFFSLPTIDVLRRTGKLTDFLIGVITVVPVSPPITDRGHNEG